MEQTASFIRIHFYTKTIPHLSEEQQSAYNLLRGSLFDEIQPHNAIEHQIFEQLVHASWQLDRARALEDHALFQLSNEPDHPLFKRNYQAFLRTRRSLDNSVQRAFKELSKLIANRVLSVAVDCNTMFTTNTDAKVPPLLDLEKCLVQSELRATRTILSMSLAKLKNPNANYTPPEEALSQFQNAVRAA